jgi:hypothetical protein
MYFCLRADLDYVPWDTPDASEFGHGEPAMVLRMLDLARRTGSKIHFFASNRSLLAFPTLVDALISEGHDLDWYCKHPENAGERFQTSQRIFAELNHKAVGMAIKGPWPLDYEPFSGLNELQFLSAETGPKPPENMAYFPVETRIMRQVLQTGSNVRLWTEQVKMQLRERATRNIGVTLAVRPQVLAKHDPKLSHLHEILKIASAAGLNTMTLRDLTEDKIPAA